jgi:hypothetical protein
MNARVEIHDAETGKTLSSVCNNLMYDNAGKAIQNCTGLYAEEMVAWADKNWQPEIVLVPLYDYVAIVPSNSTDGEYEVIGTHTAYPMTLEEIETDEPGFERWLLGTDTLPDEIEDIRGAIHDQPDRVYALRSEYGVGYFGANLID